MARLGVFEDIESPEQNNTSKTESKLVMPLESDKRKLEKLSGNKELKLSAEDQQKAEKKKLRGACPKKESLDKKKTENIESTMSEYFKDLKSRSDCPETIKDNLFEAKNLKKLSPEETAARRDEFDDKKSNLKKEWSEENGRPWPKYDKDVYSFNGKMIRKAGGDYDAHHIQPLCMNGKNEASNITPLHASEHYDKQGVHAPDSPYSKLDKML